MALPKGFISLGSKDNTINVDCINQDKCYLDKKSNRVIICDKYNNRFSVEEKLVKGKVRYSK